MTIPLSRPDLGAPERAYVQEVLGSGRLALGPYAKQFEEHMAARCGTAHAVAVSSGTAALHLMLRALGVGPGHVVLTTPFSFVASANVALYVGATPRFVDIDPATYLLDPDRVAQALTPDVRALLPVDVFGRPADWPALTALAAAHDLLLIDDACEALGATVDGVPIGRWGHGAAFGFYPNKQITLGEGGCITTDDAALAAHCRSLRNQGRATDQRMEHVELGYNYRLSELSAAVGCGQLERLDDLLARRMEVAHRYEMLLADLHDDLIGPAPVPATHHRSWFVYVIRLSNTYTAEARDALMARLQAAGIGCAPYFPCIHLQPYYRQRFGYRRGDFPEAERVADRTLALPFFPTLDIEAQAYVVAQIREALPQLPRRTTTASVRQTG